MTGGPPLLSLPKAAEHFRVSEKVLRRLASAGALPGAERLAGRWYVRAAVLRRWLEGGEAPPPASRAAGAARRA